MNIIKRLFCKHHNKILKANYTYGGKVADSYCQDCDKLLAEGCVVQLKKRNEHN